MDLETGISRPKAEQPKLREQGVLHMSIFGSVARGDNTAESDVDIAVKLDMTRKIGLSEFYDIKNYIARLLGTKIDLVHEPIRFKPRLQAEIDRDRVAAF